MQWYLTLLQVPISLCSRPFVIPSRTSIVILASNPGFDLTLTSPISHLLFTLPSLQRQIPHPPALQPVTSVLEPRIQSPRLTLTLTHKHQTQYFSPSNHGENRSCMNNFSHAIHSIDIRPVPSSLPSFIHADRSVRPLYNFLQYPILACRFLRLRTYLHTSVSEGPSFAPGKRAAGGGGGDGYAWVVC